METLYYVVFAAAHGRRRRDEPTSRACSPLYRRRGRVWGKTRNLMRADLSPAERAAHQAERKKIYETEYPETRHGAIGRGRSKRLLKMSTLLATIRALINGS
jgi:hypothetical protein